MHCCINCINYATFVCWQRSPDLWYPHMKFKILPVKINGKRSFSIIAEINEKPPRRFRNRNLSDVLPKDYWNFVPEDPQQQGAPVSRMIMSPSQVTSFWWFCK